MKCYPVMKDSGVEWLGEVPEHWEVRRLKDSLGVNEVVLPEDTEPSYRFRYIDIGSVATGRLIPSPRELRFEAAPSRARRVVRHGDTLVSTVRTYLKAVWHAGDDVRDLVASTGFAVLTPRPWILPKFVSYTCRSEPFTDRVTAESVGVTYPAIAEGRLTSALRICIPPLPEQRAITRYLDAADRRIRRYIRAKERLIELLEERKRALIHEAVTGRIDVRTGQPYPAYKDSGVEWLGEVPEHWEIVPLKWLSRRAQNGTTPPTARPAYYQNGTVPWYGPSSCGNAEEVGPPVKRLNPTAFSHGVARMVVGPAILVVVIGATAGRMALMLNKGSTNQQITAYEAATNLICPRFLLRQLRLAEDWLRSTASSATLPILDSNVVDRLPCAVPPLPEQDAIGRFLRSHMGMIDRSLTGASRQIALLREYRTRLIVDVVTGKLDVREAAADLPETDPLAGNRDRAETLPSESHLHLTEHDMAKEVYA